MCKANKMLSNQKKNKVSQTKNGIIFFLSLQIYFSEYVFVAIYITEIESSKQTKSKSQAIEFLFRGPNIVTTQPTNHSRTSSSSPFLFYI